MTEPKPRDDERLAEMRSELRDLAKIDRRIRRMFEVGEIAELLAAHDYEKARTDRAEVARDIAEAERNRTEESHGYTLDAWRTENATRLQAERERDAAVARAEQAYTEGRTAERADAVDWIRYPPGNVPVTALSLVSELWRSLAAGSHADRDSKALARFVALGGSSASVIDWRARAEQAERERDEARSEVARLAHLCRQAEEDAERHAEQASRGEAEVTRLRARVRVLGHVEQQDVEHAGITKDHVDAWFASRPGWANYGGHVLGTIWSHVSEPSAGVITRSGAVHIASTIGTIAYREQRTTWEILDEMAAMEVAT